MIGEHSVTVYADRNAADFGPPIADNAFFTDSLAGWAVGPFGTALTWSGGQINVAPGQGMARDPAYPVVMPPTAKTMRVRAVFTIDAGTGDLWWGIYYGKTPSAAWSGPFWSPGDAVESWTVNTLGPGTYALEATWELEPGVFPPPGYGYVGPSLRFAATHVGVRVDSLELAWRGGTSADLSCWVDAVAINHGREDTSTQPEPSSATLDITVDPYTGPLPALVDVGAVVVVTTTTATATSVRFTGRVTDISLGWDDAGEGTPEAGVGQIVCVGMMADLARRVIGAAPWPQELDGARVTRILEAADAPPDPTWSDPGTVQVLARDVDSQPALDVARATAESGNGVLWQTRDGETRYADAEHRRTSAVALVLDACDVLVTPTWSRTLDGLINDVSIGYGPTPSEGEQPRYLAHDDSSVQTWGRYAYTFASELAALADAIAIASLLLVRNSDPVWVLSAIPVDVAGLDAADTDALLALDVHALVTLTGLPVIGQAPTSLATWVEGWQERLARGEHDVSLTLSGYCRSAPPPRWNDVNPEWIWDTVPNTLTWDETACMGPPVNRGRWDDVPANSRWDLIPPAVTWDTWANYVPAS